MDCVLCRVGEELCAEATSGPALSLSPGAPISHLGKTVRGSGGQRGGVGKSMRPLLISVIDNLTHSCDHIFIHVPCDVATLCYAVLRVDSRDATVETLTTCCVVLWRRAARSRAFSRVAGCTVCQLSLAAVRYRRIPSSRKTNRSPFPRFLPCSPGEHCRQRQDPEAFLSPLARFCLRHCAFFSR